MSVKGAELSTPEDGMDLTTREPKGAQRVADDINRTKTGKATTEAELQGLRSRIEAARGIAPQGADLHCRDCWERGRNAAIRTIEGEKGA